MASSINLFFLKKDIVIKLVSIGVITIAIILVASPSMRSRIAMNGGSQGYSKESRLLFWKGNIELFKENLLLGVGYGINNELYFERLTENEKSVIMIEPNLQKAHAHNQYIQYLAGTGALGLMSYLALVFSILFYSYKAIRLSSSALNFERFLAVGIFVGLICFLVAGLTESNFSISKTRSLFLFLSAAGIVLHNRAIKHELK